MDTQTEQVMRKVAVYIESTQPLLDKHNEMRDTFIKRAHQVAGVLANKGLMPTSAINAFVDKVVADESGAEVWNLVEKLASAIPVDELGQLAKVASSGRKLDPWEKLVLFGDARADTRTSGMVD